MDPGPLYRIDEARLEGPVPAGPRAAFDLVPGEPARAERVLAAGDAVLAALREDGLLKASQGEYAKLERPLTGAEVGGWV